MSEIEQLEPRRLLSAVYSVRDLGTLGGGDVHVTDINIHGQVVGYAKTGSGFDHAFVWSKKHGMRDLKVPSWDGVLSNNPSTDGPSFAKAINDHGMIAIKSAAQYSAFGVSQTFVYSHGELSKITSPSHSTSAVDINNRGDILMQGSDETMMAAMVIVKEGSAPARAIVEGFAQAINDRGTIIAYPDYESAPISPQDRARLLTRAIALSDNAVLSSRWIHHRSRWIIEKNGRRSRFVVPTKFGVGPSQINNGATFVGWAVLRGDGNQAYAFVRDGKLLRDLNMLIPSNSGWEITNAVAINDKGQIAAEGVRDGKTRGLLLTPIRGAQPPQPGPTDIRLVRLPEVKPRKAVNPAAVKR